ncbi:DUF4199 domain-containing protein [Algoriphagus winogradskyi]|uniref:DUF4199 domain-containing protein n=1 Tax=Algoriphagus winogradskyi TaxID=237017 RepID=A0ABY1PKC0_9BACT|nr:DUF4199 domain-containing protein [Algoriphagus winogradskyi]SMP35564.1 Protein of unknown function [Algoriphagus winogradskyi]
MEEQQSPFQAAIKPGLTIGLVSLALTFIAYFIDSTLLGSAWFGLVAIVLFFVLIIYFGKEYRTEIGGFMSFGTAFNFSFIAMVISGLIGLLGQILLFHVIDPSLASVLADQAFETQMSMMEKFGQNPDSMDPAILEQMRASTSKGFTLSGQLMSFGFGLIVYAIIALILGAILKKKDKSLDY